MIPELIDGGLDLGRVADRIEELSDLNDAIEVLEKIGAFYDDIQGEKCDTAGGIIERIGAEMETLEAHFKSFSAEQLKLICFAILGAIRRS